MATADALSEALDADGGEKALIKRPWTTEEDEALLEAIQK